MKNFFVSLFLLFLLCTGVNSANALTYEQATSQSKPVAILIYAPWADGAQTAFNAFKAVEAKTPSYNFVTMNIATKEAKTYNKTYSIFPNLPYVMIMKERGKVTRTVKTDCVMDAACFADRLKMFNP